MKTKMKKISKTITVRTARKHQEVAFSDGHSKGFTLGWSIAFGDVLLFGNDKADDSIVRLLRGVSGVFDCPHCFATQLVNQILEFTDDTAETVKYINRVLYLMGETKFEHPIDIEFKMASVEAFNTIKRELDEL